MTKFNIQIKITAFAIILLLGITLSCITINLPPEPTIAPSPTVVPKPSMHTTTPTPKPTRTSLKNGFIVCYDEQPLSVGYSGRGVQLVNNKEAQNPTLQQLYAFLKQDKTDQDTYLRDLRVCTDFAEKLHNNAERMKIKAAFVTIRFSDDPVGHALNAFETIDKGLVFVDCTGEEPRFLTPPIDMKTGKPVNNIVPESFDKIAFIEVGRKYALISLAAINYPRTIWRFSPEYNCYLNYQQLLDENESQTKEFISKVEDFKSKIETFDKDAKAFETMLGGRTLIADFAEYEKLTKMLYELKERESKIKADRNSLLWESEQLIWEYNMLGGSEWKPGGLVKSVEIYW